METYLVIFVNYDDGVVYREVQARTAEEARELILQDNYVKHVIDVQPLIDSNKYLKYYEIKKLPVGTKIEHNSGITYEIKEINKNSKGSQDTYVTFTDGSTLNFDTSEEGERSEFILAEEIKIGETAMSTLNEMMFAGNRELSESQLNEAVRNFTFETKDGEHYDIPAATADDAITSFHRRFPTVQDEDVKAFYDDSDIYYDMITGEELDEQKLNELFNANISPNFSPNVNLDLSGGGAASLLGLLGESSEHGFSVGDKVYYVDDEPKVPGEIVEIYDDGTCLVIVNGDPDDQVVVSMDSIDYWDDNLGECTMTEDTVRKANGKWVNRGDDGKEHGEFDTKAEADAQRRAMYASGYKGESKKRVNEEITRDNYAIYRVCLDILTDGEEPKVGPGSKFVSTLYKTFDELGYPLVNDSYSFDFEDMTEYYNEEDIEELLDESKKKMNEALDADGFEMLMDEIRKHNVSIEDLEHAIEILNDDFLYGKLRKAVASLSSEFEIKDDAHEDVPLLPDGDYSREAWISNDDYHGYAVGFCGGIDDTGDEVIQVYLYDNEDRIGQEYSAEFNLDDADKAADLANKLVSKITPDTDPKDVISICDKLFY